MSDLFLPPLTPTSGSNAIQNSSSHEANFAEISSRNCSIYDVADVRDPTLAWVQSLPSPNNDNLSCNGFLSRPEFRLLETPRPNFEPRHLESRFSSESRHLSTPKPNNESSILETPRPINDSFEPNVKSKFQVCSGNHNVGKKLPSKKQEAKSTISRKDKLKRNANMDEDQEYNYATVHSEANLSPETVNFDDVLAAATRDAGIDNFSSFLLPSSQEDLSTSKTHEESVYHNLDFLHDTSFSSEEHTANTNKNLDSEHNENLENSATTQNSESILFVDHQSIANDFTKEQSSGCSNTFSNENAYPLFTINSQSQALTEKSVTNVVENAKQNLPPSDSPKKRKFSDDKNLPDKRFANSSSFSPAPIYATSSSSSLQMSSDNLYDEKRAASVGSSICSSVANEVAVAQQSRLPDKKLLSDIVRRYLKKRDDMKVVILHAKVAQKSYGSEKRFFCPPPCVHLLGGGWKTKQRRKASSSSIQSPLPSPSRFAPSVTSSVGASEVCLFMGVGGGGNELQQIHLDLPHKNYAAAKTLHTPDSDKRKNFEIHVKMFYGDGSEIGLFQSQRIKVISKPSKKKQTVKNTELCIPSGSKVALFNRLRSQTVSTRYLYVTEDGFKASASQWGAFAIHLIDHVQPESEVFDVEDGYIHYGTTIKLVCSVTGLALPRIVIRKVDKQMAVIDSDEPVSQLHKCALYLKDTDRQYLCLAQEKIIAYKATPYAKNQNMDKLSDGACWTIISTDKSEYCWSDSAFNLVNNVSVTPIPVVKNLEINGGNETAMAELSGENFSPNLTVWFADIEAETMFRCNECIVCIVPEISQLQPTWKYVKKTVKVPLLLVREDGVIYPCGINFYYTPELGPKKNKYPSIKQILKQKQILQNDQG